MRKHQRREGEPQHAKMLEMHKAGKSAEDIAYFLNYNVEYVRQKLRDMKKDEQKVS